ncbi:Hsp20/alpha crystallin family protein [Methanohalobium sp.]|uniref:Hsp20/alpha crystallin family protein n=1 Tax=Methanohalobium sp. TaxID=2837493 RepID=UPI0025D693C1|nr:Hsp20/alpha crystallin family protein [Methanohalobium sp.]
MEKLTQSPYVYAYPDNNSEKLNIEIKLPGVKKENINLKLEEDRFSVNARNKNKEYVGTYSTSYLIDPDRAVTKYSNNKLYVIAPMWM